MDKNIKVEEALHNLVRTMCKGAGYDFVLVTENIATTSFKESRRKKEPRLMRVIKFIRKHF